jgi:hypothetical protein
MTAKPDNNEIKRLATIVKVFNDVSTANMQRDADAQLKLQRAMTPERMAQAQEKAVELMEMGMTLMMKGGDDALESAIAEKSIVLVDWMMNVVKDAGLEDKIAESFPAGEKTAANAESFRKLGAENLARLCLK